MLTLGVVSAAVSSGFYTKHAVITYLPGKAFDQKTANGPLFIEVTLIHESYIIVVRRLTQ